MTPFVNLFAYFYTPFGDIMQNARRCIKGFAPYHGDTVAGMKAKNLVSLCLFIVCVGVGGFGGVAVLLHLCDKAEAVPGVREYVAGSVLGAVALVVFVWGGEVLLSYAARKYAEKKTTSEPKHGDHGQGD